MKQNTQQNRSQTRTPVRAKRLESNANTQSIQSTQISSQLNNSTIQLSVLNSKQLNQSIDSIVFDNNINFTNNNLESQGLDNGSSLDDQQSSIYSKSYKQDNSLLIQRTPPLQNLEFLLKPKRKLSTKQKEVNKIIGRLCEERLFPTFIKECSQAGLLTKEQVHDYDIKQHFKNQRAEQTMLTNKSLLKQLNLNSGYNTIGNYAGTNKYLKVDLDYDKLTIDPQKTRIPNRQKRIKTFFEGYHPQQIKMKVLPPLKPVQMAFEQAEDARKQKKKCNSAHLDSQLNQYSSTLSFQLRDVSRERLLLKDASLSQHNKTLDLNEGGIKTYDTKKQFKLELDQIFSSGQLPTINVYETDLEKYQKRITPTPFKKNFMPPNYKDRIVALNVKY